MNSTILRLIWLAIVVILLPVLVGLAVGKLVGEVWMVGAVGLLWGICSWFFLNWASERFMLDVYGAKLLDTHRDPRLYELTVELSGLAEIEPPTLYLSPMQAANACAVARSNRNSVLIVTVGLLQNLSREDIRAVVAMMIARIADGNAKVCTLASTIAGLPLHWTKLGCANDLVKNPHEVDPAREVTGLKKLVLTIVLPFCAAILRGAFTPSSIYDADAAAVKLTGQQQAVEAALIQIEGSVPTTWWQCSGYNLATAMLFAVPPLPPISLLTTHPPYWLRALLSFPYYHPTIAERRERVRGVDVAAAPLADTFTALDEVDQYIKSDLGMLDEIPPSGSPQSADVDSNAIGSVISKRILNLE